ncbi:MAG: DUF4384 domain-containing protein [Candidatus Zixiibacteriota bacterium]
MKAQPIIRMAAGVGTLMLMVGTATAQKGPAEKIQIVPVPNEDLQVWIWPDRGEGATYREGDPIAFYVEATRDCFLILYDIDTRGRLQMLFPADPWDDNFITAGESIRFPRPQDGYDWRVDGPAGTEYVQAIASEFPIPLPDWPVYLRSVNGGDGVCADPELRDFRCGDDRLGYMDIVNHKIAGRYWDWCAADLATFEVRPRRIHHVSVVWDPWPDVFYGQIYIGWPIGGRIYIDGIYIGIAPLWIPRHHYGRHVITCYSGSRLVRRHRIEFRPKREYRGPIGSDGGYERARGNHTKVARRGTPPSVIIERDRSHGLQTGTVTRERRDQRQITREPVHVGREKAERRSSVPPGRDLMIRTGDVRQERNRDAEVKRNDPPPSAKGAFKEKRQGWWGSVTQAVKGAARDLAASAGAADRDRHATSRGAAVKNAHAKGDAKPGNITKTKSRPETRSTDKGEKPKRRERD